jgi:hypothetical protein
MSQDSRPAAAMITIVILLSTAMSRAAPAKEPAAPGGPPKLLVLTDGRIVQGRIGERPGAYLVEKPGGQIVIPFDWVRLSAVSLDEAYQMQRDSLMRPNASDHVGLAQWCFTNQLFSQAAEQLEAALRLEPQRSDARELLLQIERATGARPDPAASAPEAAATPDGFAQPDARTASGLRTATHGEFMRRIQPLLVNKCASAGCHGPAGQTDFQLHPVRTGQRNARSAGNDNLATVVTMIDAARPDDSPLLRALRDRTAPTHRGLFDGPRGSEQFQLLRNWVLQAAADRDAASDLETDGTPHVLGAETSDPPEAPAAVRTASASRPHATESGGKTPHSAVTSELLQSILAEERPDAFDPREFNRLVHGEPRR